MNELLNVGISEHNHEKLRRLKDNGPFLEMQDAYRFGIALALARGAEPRELIKRQNLYATTGVDPDGSLAAAIKILLPTSDIPVSRLFEQLADWGVPELYRLEFEEGGLNFTDLLNQGEVLDHE